MGKEKYTRWFLEVYGETNQKVADALGTMCQLGSSFQIITDKRYFERPVWEVNYPFIEMLKKARKNFPYEFRIFAQEGRGVPREVNIINLRHTSKKVREAIEAVDKIKKRKTGKTPASDE